MDWFDGEGAKMKALEPKHTAAKHASLAAKKTKAERQLSQPRIE